MRYLGNKESILTEISNLLSNKGLLQKTIRINNRSTFYLHYENTFDLLQETTRYILDKHFAYYSADAQSITNFITQVHS